MVPLSGTRERGNLATLRERFGVFRDDLGHAKVGMLEPQCMAAPEDPCLKFVFTVLYALATLDPEELRVQGATVEHHVVRLEACDLGLGAHMPPLLN